MAVGGNPNGVQDFRKTNAAERVVAMGKEQGGLRTEEEQMRIDSTAGRNGYLGTGGHPHGAKTSASPQSHQPVEPVGRTKAAVTEHGEMKIRARDLLAILRDQGYRCAITGRELTPSTATPDHIVPVGRGGAERDINNIQIVHTDVNRAKGVMHPDEFLQLCREVVAWADGNRG